MLRSFAPTLIFFLLAALVAAASPACDTGIGASSTAGVGGAGGSTLAGPDCGGDCGTGLHCCSGRCINPDNDVTSCGGCGVVCGGPAPFCDHGKCGTPPCSTTCAQGTCCGGACCDSGQLCCAEKLGKVELACAAPVDGTCPIGCVGCP